MADFKFLRNPTTGKTVISAPRRARRMDVSKKTEPVCPFCVGRENEEEELYRIPARPHPNPSTPVKQAASLRPALKGEVNSVEWLVRVIPNKFPFTPYHEIVVLSPDHHKGFDELPFSHLELILQTYRERYNANSKHGQVYIFHNGGLGSGESIPHPHTQIAVVPFGVELEIPQLPHVIARKHDEAIPSIMRLPRSFFARNDDRGEKVLETDHFVVFCPTTSEWPDEVWVSPKRGGQVFGSIDDDEISDLAFVISRLIQIFDLRHGHEFPFNFYIYPGKNWYFRLIPRMKVLGGFEVGTGVMINTQDPEETLTFIKEHFWKPDIEKIKTEHQADYIKRV